jgi:hypothetical protein
MDKRVRMVAIVFLAASLAACNLPGAASPTPFTFPTPNLTHTAIFAATPTTPAPAVTAPLSEPTTVVATAEPTASATAIGATTAPTATSSSLSSRPNGDPVTAAYLSTAPVIDGALDEWTTTPYTANQTVPNAGGNWSGASDLSAVYYLGWDANYLYVAVRRTDDVFVQISWGRYMYRGDDIEIQLDTDLPGDFYTAGMGADDYQIGLSPGNFGSIDPEAYRWYPRNLESWIHAASVSAKLVDSGYTLEAKIPWSAFNLTPVAGGHYGFALSLSDNDVAGTSAWQSMVSSVSTRRTSDPTTWGTLILAEPSGD